jgi:hypothetical protein
MKALEVVLEIRIFLNNGLGTIPAPANVIGQYTSCVRNALIESTNYCQSLSYQMVLQFQIQ